MLRTICCFCIALLISSLSACSIEPDADLKSAMPANEVSSATDAGTVLGDGGIEAPTIPTLSISATAGALNFKWVDWRTKVKGITDTRLYEYNNRTEREIEIETDIEPEDLTFTLPIKPHRLAWDAVSYRIEICTIENCVSSLRVPIRTLLTNAVTAITPLNTELSNSFGDDLALNASGNMAVASSPANSSAVVFLHNDQHWVQASTLRSDHFFQTNESVMRASVSASGDTVAIASLSSSTNPVIVVFDRLGENWFETAVITPFAPVAIAPLWDTASLNMHLSDNGDRIAFAAQPENQSVNVFDNRDNQILIFDRNTISWSRSASLTIASQHTRLRATSASGTVHKVMALSALNGALYLHEFTLSESQWRETSSQIVDTLNPSIDTQIVSSHDATKLALAAWEFDSNTHRSTVSLKLEKHAAGWVRTDSIRLPPTADSSAKLRIATDAHLHSLAIGWQAQADANLAFYAVQDAHWQHLFSVPEGFDLNRSVPLAQSIVISADNSTALIGTSNTGSGGMASSFR